MENNFPVLLVEDDPNDAFLLRIALDSAAVKNLLVVVPGGREAIEYLSSEHGSRPLPCLLVTDLKMPGLDGFGLLSWLRNQSDLKSLPAVVLSSSDIAADQKRAMELGASEYFVKPSSFPALVEVAKRFYASWIAPRCSSEVSMAA